jgi:hypothetical protein
MRGAVVFVLLLCILPGTSRGYSVLTHEELIDLTWKDLLRPLLRQRFPQASEAELDRAHAYASGGCAIQDLGYYPFSNQLFSNLTHYVRSGDFVTNLLRDAKNADELSFALGALSHYVGDTVGHHDAINRATAIAFPKLARKYGDSIAYDQSPHAHIRTEFAFDIDELSKHRLARAPICAPWAFVCRAVCWPKRSKRRIRCRWAALSARTGRRSVRTAVQCEVFCRGSPMPRPSSTRTIFRRRRTTIPCGSFSIM